MTLPLDPAPHDSASAALPAGSEPEVVAATIVDEPAPLRGHLGLAWGAILLMTVLIVAGMQLRPAAQSERFEKDDPAAAEAEEEEESAVDHLMGLGAEMQGKVAVGMREFQRGQGQEMSASEQQTLLAQLDEAMNVGDPLARLRFVVMAGELAGPQQALDELGELRDKLAQADRQLKPTEQQLADALEQVYRGFVAAPAEPAALDEAQTKLLADKLGWFGRLALAPAEGPDQAARQQLLGAAQRTLLWGGGAMFVAGSVALVGLVLLVTILILAGNGTLSSGVIPSPIPPGIYAESFAIWMFTFVLFNVALLAIPLGDLKMLGVLAAQFCSMLLALAWPRFRGVPWRVIRHDAGIYLPRFAWLEPLRGLATYALSTPILGVGLVVMLILTQAKGLLDGPTDPFARPDVPAHPIVEVVRSENPWMFWQILLVAAVGAPIVEEIMFRGVLYRSLRDSTRNRRVLTSIILSMGVSGFIFAVIHPQGWLGIPVLGALATGFAIAREWGGTIWPSVIAHAFNNGMVTVLLFTLFRQ